MSSPEEGTRVYYITPGGERVEGTVDGTLMSELFALVEDDGARWLILRKSPDWGVVV